jgi:predicted ArsR family transcriptional regulator
MVVTDGRAQSVPCAEQLAPEYAEDASTRQRVSRLILQHGPSTAAQLAQWLGLTSAAVRRHLSLLLDLGHLTTRDQRIYGARGRGRPAKVFVLTDLGRREFTQSYDTFGIEAVDYIADRLGSDAVTAFADQVMARLTLKFSVVRERYGNAADALVGVLNDEGYVASVLPVASGRQLCQYHCPISHVARAYPQFCIAETKAFARLLGSHVQRLATIAQGDEMCTTHIPRPVAADTTERKPS